MADEEQRFEDTMEALEAQREEIEAGFGTQLEMLSGRIDELNAAIAEATARQRRQVQARREALAAVDAPVADEVAWPQAGDGARGRANRFVRWLLRDFLAVLDRREAGLRESTEAVRLRVDRLQATVDAEEALADAVETTMARLHEALHAALEAQAKVLTLINAKDAEVLQRAVAGPLRRMEVLFDEFGRQQEALLSQLVGRRAQLDELVRAVTPAPDDEM